MLRLISPIFILAIVQKNKIKIKKILFLTITYSLFFFIISDFEDSIHNDFLIFIKTVKWLIIMLAFFHISAIFKKKIISNSVNEKKHLKNLDKNSKKPISKSKKIISKYKK